MSNVKILRLNNCGTNPNIIQDTDNSGFRYTLNPDLINNGRCLVEVISGWSQITQQTLGNSIITATTRIVPNNIPQLVIRSNILQEGEDTLTGGGGLILGTMSLSNIVYTGNTPISGTTNSGFFNQNDSLSFICDKLPSQIHLERLYWSADATPILKPAVLPSQTPALLPFEVVLKLTFIDEM